MTIEDVNKYTGRSPNGTIMEVQWNNRYGMDNNLNIIDAGEGNKPSRTYTSTTETGYYRYNPSINWDTWLASRNIKLTQTTCIFNYFCISNYSTGVDSNPIAYIYSTKNPIFETHSDPVMPVVTIRPDIQLWRTPESWIETEVATGTATATAKPEYIPAGPWQFK